MFISTSFLLGYDKLKPYGFPIQGYFSGYTWKIPWLEVVRSDDDPRILAQLFLDLVFHLKGSPMVVNSDCGTENGSVAAMQCHFCSTGIDRFSGERSHIYDSSNSNQRIEGWWSFLRRQQTSWWMDFFKDMVKSNILNVGNDLHMKCL